MQLSNIIQEFETEMWWEKVRTVGIVDHKKQVISRENLFCTDRKDDRQVRISNMDYNLTHRSTDYQLFGYKRLNER